jgi:hypothetical protein
MEIGRLITGRGVKGITDGRRRLAKGKSGKNQEPQSR